MAMMSKLWSKLASGARDYLPIPSTIGHIASVGAQASIFEAATRTTSSTTPPSSSIDTGYALEFIKYAVVVATILGILSLVPVTQAAVCQYRIQHDNSVKTLTAKLNEREDEAVVDAALLQKRTAELSDLASQHQRQINDMKVCRGKCPLLP